MIEDSGAPVNPLERAALNYVHLGWSVFPLHPNSKKPATSNGVHDATTDAERVRDWWRSNPYYNIGIACGTPSGGLVVVDFDDGAQWEGYEPTVITPGGGYHYYMREHPYALEGGRTFNHAHGEVRSTGSYVVAPPSIHPDGGTYVTRGELNYAGAHPLPERKGVDVTPDDVDFGGAVREDVLAEASEFLSVRFYDYVVNGFTGDRSATEYHIACEMVRRGLSDSEIKELFDRYLARDSHYSEHRYPERYLAHTIGKARAEQRKASVEKQSLQQQAAAERKGQGWQIRTLADAYQPRPPLEWAIHGIFQFPSLNIVYGAPSSLKSMLMADATLAVASGQCWLPVLGSGKGVATAASPTLWVDYDNGRRRTDERFDAIGRHKKLDDNVPHYYATMQVPWLNLSAPDSVRQLEQVITQLGARFIVIDNLGLVIGDADENSHEMARVMGNLRWLADEHNACINVIHHQRKSNGMNTRRGESLRGSTTIEAALDLALLIEREERSDAITCYATKTRGYDVAPFGAQFAFDANEQKELLRAGFYGIRIVDYSSDHAIDREIVTALRASERALNQTDLTGAVHAVLDGVGEKRIRARLALLVEQQQVITEAGPNNATLHRLPLRGEGARQLVIL